MLFALAIVKPLILTVLLLLTTKTLTALLPLTVVLAAPAPFTVKFLLITTVLANV